MHWEYQSDFFNEFYRDLRQFKNLLHISDKIYIAILFIEYLLGDILFKTHLMTLYHTP